MFSKLFKHCVCLFLCLAILAPTAFATGGGGGGGRDSGPGSQDKQVFDDRPPYVPGVPAVPDSVWGIPPKYWDFFEGTLTVLDYAGSASTAMLTGPAWWGAYQIGHAGVKVSMVLFDQKKKDFVTKVLSAIMSP